MTATWRILEGDCVKAMTAMPDASVDAVVTDPPYGLGFMGKEWDTARAMARPPSAENAAPETAEARGAYPRTGKGPQAVAFESRAFQAWCEVWAREALRVLKPGGHLLAFGGTRTYHRLACAIEDAGFEIRDCLAWLYGSGFPKSLDVSKAIDKAAGAEREVVGRKTDPRYAYAFPESSRPYQGKTEHDWAPDETSSMANITAPATPDAERWQGWGTALKPAHEPIVLARKPLAGTVAANVLEHGTGALNINGCRIEGEQPHHYEAGRPSGERSFVGRGNDGEPVPFSGRWPANVTMDEQAAAMLDDQTAHLHGAGHAREAIREADPTGMFSMAGDGQRHGDSGGASRFLYVAKASSEERNRGLDGFAGDEARNYSGGPLNRPEHESSDGVRRTGTRTPRRNSHPTVKPVELMRWLVRLVTPPNGTVLDPFAGSGTTGIAALREGFSFIGIEREPEYVAIARARIIGDAPLLNGALEEAA